MTTQSSTLEISGNLSLLKKALVGNAVFSGVSGVFLAVAASWTAAFLGLDSATPITALGLILILYAPFLAWLSAQPRPRSWLVWMVIELDILWVLGSAILIFTGILPGLTVAGKWGIAAIADIVAVIALLQYIGLRRSQ